MAHILIVEDDELINNLVKENLLLVGHECEQVYDGKAALESVLHNKYDLIILDIMLPYASGYEILPKCGNMPVIMLTAKDATVDKVKGLNLGAEDYIVKPFDMLELIARVNVVLRRNKTADNIVMIDSVKIDLNSHIVTQNEEEIYLTIKEFELLSYFILNKNIALSRDTLLENVWGYDYDGDERTVDVHVASLRKKLGLNNRLKTVYKLGYRLEF